MRRLREMCLEDDPQQIRRVLLFTGRLVDEISNATRGSSRWAAEDEEIEELDVEISEILQAAGSVAEALHELGQTFGFHLRGLAKRIRW